MRMLRTKKADLRERIVFSYFMVTFNYSTQIEGSEKNGDMAIGQISRFYKGCVLCYNFTPLTISDKEVKK